MNMTFRKITSSDKDTIFQWLDEPHVKEFWDNTQAHRDDILIFMGGREQSSTYFGGIFNYWLGSIDTIPYCFLMTSEYNDSEDLSDLHRQSLAKSKKAIGIDFCIGNVDFLGKKLAAPTLKLFMDFICNEVDPRVDTFFIDPNDNNPRAIHVYRKAGFEIVGKFDPNSGYFVGNKSILMVKNYPSQKASQPNKQ